MSETAAPKTVSFLAAMRDFFGLGVNPDGSKKTITQFGAEIKALSAEDRAYFVKHLQDAGYNVAAS